MREVVVVAAVRTAIGTFGGSLKDVPPTQLAALVVREAVARAGVQPGQVGAVVFGHVINTEPKDMYLSRVAAIDGGGEPSVLEPLPEFASIYIVYLDLARAEGGHGRRDTGRLPGVQAAGHYPHAAIYLAVSRYAAAGHEEIPDAPRGQAAVWNPDALPLFELPHLAAVEATHLIGRFPDHRDGYLPGGMDIDAVGVAADLVIEALAGDPVFVGEVVVT